MCLMLYLIPFLHQTTTLPWYTDISQRCILFHFYIKPQLDKRIGLLNCSCILFHFYIKPQLKCAMQFEPGGCILFHFYIKPQLVQIDFIQRIVVSYSISTSNHNAGLCVWQGGKVVSYSISTSNHNLWRIRRYFQAHYHLNHILIFNGML